MINLLELQKMEERGELNVINLDREIEALPEDRGHYSITRSGKRKYDISQEALFKNLLNYSYSSFRRLGAEKDMQQSDGLMGGTIGDLAMLTSPETRAEWEKQNEETREYLLSQTSFYQGEARKYRDLLNEEIDRDPSGTQRFFTGMPVQIGRQIADPNQWLLLSLSSGVGGYVGGKAAGFLGKKLSEGTANRIGGFMGRAINEGIEEAIDQYTVDGDIDMGGVITSGLAGGFIGEVPWLTKFLAQKVGLAKAPNKVTAGVQADVKTLKQNAEENLMKNIAETKNPNKTDVNNLAELSEATEIQGNLKGKNLSAKEIFTKSILIEGQSLEKATNEYLPKIADYFINNKVLKGVTDEESFFEAVSKDGKAVKEAFRKLGRRKDLPEDLKEAVDWYNVVMDETRLKSISVDQAKALDNTIGALDRPSEYKIWAVPEESIGQQTATVPSEIETILSPIADYAVNNNLIKGVATKEDFFSEINKNSRNIRKFFRNAERNKAMPEDIRKAFKDYNVYLLKDEIEAKPKETILNPTAEAPKIKTETNPNSYAQSIENASNSKTGTSPTATIMNPPKKTSYQIEEKYPFMLEEVNKNVYEERMKDRIKHNSRDYTKKQLENELRKDLKIPKNADVKLVNGNIPKTKVPIITGKDYDGNAVTGRSKWLRHTPEAEIEWVYKGERYYAKVEIVDNKWRGDIYKYNPKKNIEFAENKAKAPEIKEQLEKIAPPENPYEEIYGRYEPSKQEIKDFNDFKNRLAKFLGLDKLNLEATPKEKAALQRKIAKAFGNFVKSKHKFKNLDEMIDYYKKKKGIDFEFEIIPKREGMLGETKMYISSDGNKVKISLTQEAMEDFDLAAGVLRHEIEHATDFIKRPDFEGRPYHWMTPEKDMTVGEYFDTSTGGHFFRDNGSMYELNYIAANMMNDMVHNGKLNKEVVKRLGFDMIPENPTAKDLELISQAVEKSKAEQDAVKRLAKLKRELSNSFTVKKGLWQAFLSGSIKERADSAKEFIKTNILLPFERIDNQMQIHMLKAFEIEHNGMKYNINELLLLFEANKSNFTNWCFYWGEELPKELKPIEPKLLELRKTLNKTVDKLIEGTSLTRMDIINAVNYDRNLNIMQLIPDNEIKNFMKPDGTFDYNKFWNGKMELDQETGITAPERALRISEKFVETNWGFFNSADKQLKALLKNKKATAENLKEILEDARRCMSLNDFTNLLRKYEVEKIPEMEEWLLKRQNLFQAENKLFGDGTEADIQKAIEMSKKKNAKRFFLRDMESVKGDKNPTWGTHLHKFGRFVNAEADGIMARGKVSEFVKQNSVDPMLMTRKLIQDVSTAYAIRDTMPSGGMNGLKKILNEISKQISDDNKKTYIKDVEKYIDMEIGYKLGRITNPPQGTLDKIVDTFLEWTARINLMGPKAFKEILQEPGGMTESKIQLWGGSGIIGTYKDMLKAQTIIMKGGEDLRAVNSVLGDRYHRSVSLEAFNIMKQDLGDFTGYYAKRRATYGTKSEKLSYNLRTGIEKLNWYSYTQRCMKLAANFGAGHIMENLTKFKNIDEVFSNNTMWVKRTFRDIGIDDVEFSLIKDFTATETFQKYGIFDEIQFSDMLTPERYSELLGREITPDEFNILREATVKKASKLNERIVSDISPTETSGATKAQINTIEDPILRNFVKLMGFFKTSIAEGWRRKVRNYKMANIDPDTGKYDFHNVVYQKRLLKTLFNKAGFLTAAAVLGSGEFYEDPVEYISEQIDELAANPTSLVWSAAQEDFNLWGLTTGANAIRRPISVVSNASKGKWDKVGKSLIQMGVNTTNYNMGEKAYKYLFD